MILVFGKGNRMHTNAAYLRRKGRLWFYVGLGSLAIRLNGLVQNALMQHKN